MPIYEYQCSNCDHRLEALQKISDAPLTECPSCHENALKKLVSAAGFRLKGGGWYETDFKQKGRKQLAESDSKSSDSGAKSDSKTSDSSGDKSAGQKKDQSTSGTATSKPASKTTD